MRCSYLSLTGHAEKYWLMKECSCCLAWRDRVK